MVRCGNYEQWQGHVHLVQDITPVQVPAYLGIGTCTVLRGPLPGGHPQRQAVCNDARGAHEVGHDQQRSAADRYVLTGVDAVIDSYSCVCVVTRAPGILCLFWFVVVDNDSAQDAGDGLL